MTHAQLVHYAKLYLLSAKNCNPVFTERGSANIGYFPDVLGWTAQNSFQIECKVSKSDLLADKKKLQHNDVGIGSRRYYCVPYELYDKVSDLIPLGYGHLICKWQKGAVPIIEQVRFRGSKEFESDIRKEMLYLRSRILQIQNYGK